MAWACSHWCTLDDDLVDLDLQKWHLERHKDEQCQLNILIPRGKGILGEEHDVAVEGCFGAAKTYFVKRQHLLWPGMLTGVHHYLNSSDMCMWLNQLRGKVVGLQNALRDAWWHLEWSVVSFITNVKTPWRGDDSIVTLVDPLSRRVF